jgi:hypothetical protein
MAFKIVPTPEEQLDEMRSQQWAESLAEAKSAAREASSDRHHSRIEHLAQRQIQAVEDVGTMVAIMAAFS